MSSTDFPGTARTAAIACISSGSRCANIETQLPGHFLAIFLEPRAPHLHLVRHRARAAGRVSGAWVLNAAGAHRARCARSAGGFRRRISPSARRNRPPRWCICAVIRLGLQTKSTADYVAQELIDWQRLAVLGHHAAERPWISYHERACAALAMLVGADETEVVAMNSLTVNLHLMMVSFFRPSGRTQPRAHRKIGVSLRSLRRRLATRISRTRCGGAPDRGRAARQANAA